MTDYTFVFTCKLPPEDVWPDEPDDDALDATAQQVVDSIRADGDDALTVMERWGWRPGTTLTVTAPDGSTATIGSS